MVSTAVVLKKATVSAIPYPNEQGFSIRAERNSRYLTKKVYLLLFLKTILYIIHMNKVSWFGHGHELAIRCETD